MFFLEAQRLHLQQSNFVESRYILLQLQILGNTEFEIFSQQLTGGGKVAPWVGGKKAGFTWGATGATGCPGGGTPGGGCVGGIPGNKNNYC